MAYYKNIFSKYIKKILRYIILIVFFILLFPFHVPLAFFIWIYVDNLTFKDIYNEPFDFFLTSREFLDDDCEYI